MQYLVQIGIKGSDSFELHAPERMKKNVGWRADGTRIEPSLADKSLLSFVWVHLQGPIWTGSDFRTNQTVDDPRLFYRMAGAVLPWSQTKLSGVFPEYCAELQNSTANAISDVFAFTLAELEGDTTCRKSPGTRELTERKKPGENNGQDISEAKGEDDDQTGRGLPLRQHSLCGIGTAKPSHDLPLPVLPEGDRLGLHGRTDFRRGGAGDPDRGAQGL